MARLIDGPVTVELRAPPPLDTAIDVISTEAGFEARLGETLIMRVKPASLMGEVPEPLAPEIAIKGRDSFMTVEDHAFPECFVCGPLRKYGDGLCIFTARVEGYDGVHDIWIPHNDFAGTDGTVKPEILWAALDCPGAFACGNQENPMVLASISGEILTLPKAGIPLVVTGWSTFHDGRKHGAGSAIHSEDGTLIAHTEQLWIELRPA